MNLRGYGTSLVLGIGGLVCIAAGFGFSSHHNNLRDANRIENPRVVDYQDARRELESMAYGNKLLVPENVSRAVTLSSKLQELSYDKELIAAVREDKKHNQNSTISLLSGGFPGVMISAISLTMAYYRRRENLEIAELEN